jgi:pseudoazurin
MACSAFAKKYLRLSGADTCAAGKREIKCDKGGIMPFHMPRRQFIGTAAAASALSVAPQIVGASTVREIEMLNRHPEVRANMVFYPEILVAQPGDSVRFVASAGGHNTQSVDGMLPDGAEGWRGRTNEEVELSLEIPGYYGYICLPHAAMGMAGVIIVEGDGKMDNFETARSVEHRQRPLQQKFDEIFAQIEADGLAG